MRKGGTDINIICESIIEQYADLVYRIAVSQTGNLHDAEDIFQDVFIQLMKNQNKIKNEEHLKHWLIRTTVNRVKNYHLCFWRRKVDLSDSIEEVSFLSPEEQAEILAVREAVGALPGKLRAVVYLYYYEEYSVEEISEILSIPPGTVKSRLYNARRLLKPKLEPERGTEPETEHLSSSIKTRLN